RGYGDKIWFLEINKSHGFIRFIAKDTIQDGALEIDSKTYMSLDDAENVPALEGAHKITVTGSNIEDFSADITVERGRSEIIDLSEAKFTASVIKITSAIEGYKLIIDGEERSTDDTLALPMGEYRFEAYKEGYLPWIKSVEAKEPETEVKIELVEEVILRALVIDTFPAAAELYVDNGYVGHAPVTELVTEGKHTIAAKLEGYSDATLEADVTSETDGERYSLRLIKKSDDSQSQKEETLTIPIDGRY
ncbi:MAG: PEGA domain-containing protein, partial [Clostridiales bacterium]|nr:PEGA domain-containing protein [Clostridiales bacterium]